MEQLAAKLSIQAENVTSRGIAKSQRLSFLAALSFGVAGISLAFGGMLPFSKIAGTWPGNSLPGLILTGLFAAAFVGWVYCAIGAVVPRSGADYIFSSRVLRGPAPFLASWLMVVLATVVSALMAIGLARTLTPAVLRTIGIAGNIPGLLKTSDWAASPSGTMLIGSVVVFIAYGSALLPARWTGRAMIVALALGVLAWGGLLFQLAFPISPMAVGWDRALGEGSYDLVLLAAQSQRMAGYPGLSGLLMGGVTLVTILFLGAFSPVFFAQEVDRPQRNLPAAVFGALALSGLIFGAAASLLSRSAPQAWFAAQSYLALSGQPASPWILLYGAVLRPLPALTIFAGAAFMVLGVNAVQAFLFFTSRILVAWARDGWLPEEVGSNKAESHSPVWAVMTAAIAAEGVVMIAALGANVEAVIPVGLYAGCGLLVPTLAAAVFPNTSPDRFAATPGWVRARIGKLPLLSIFAGLAALILVWNIAAAFIFPVKSASSWGGLFVFAGVLAAGWGWMQIRRRKIDGDQTNEWPDETSD